MMDLNERADEYLASLPKKLYFGEALVRDLRARVAELEAGAFALEDVLRRNGFVRCNIAACNCGSWHAVYGLRERMDEIADALAEAGHPIDNSNGHIAITALRNLTAERDRLVGEVQAERGKNAGLRGHMFVMEQEDARLTAERDALRDALQNCVALLENADCSDGYCCCGSPVAAHGMGDGHSPVDAGEYHKDSVLSMAQDALAIDAARAAGEREDE